MTPRHQETNFSEMRPARFYRAVAITFLLLTLVLLGAIFFMSSKQATITVTSKLEPIDLSASIGVGSGMEFPGAVVTSTVTLQKKFSPSGSRTETGVAVGTVTLYNDTSSEQALIPTTRLLTASGTLFRIKSRVSIPAHGTVSAEVYADVVGVESEIGPSDFTIPGLPKDKQKVIYARSTEKMKGGETKIGILTADDLKKAEEQLVSELKGKAQEEMQKLYPDYKGVYSVIQSVTEADSQIGKEISEFSVTGRATVLGVFYDETKIKEKVENDLKKRVVSDSEIVKPRSESPAVVLDKYDLISNTATLTVSYGGVASLNPDSKKLEKFEFFGMGKDEIRRYLLALDHVYSVDVKFSPAWVSTVPHVSDHVFVIVKTIE